MEDPTSSIPYLDKAAIKIKSILQNSKNFTFNELADEVSDSYHKLAVATHKYGNRTNLDNPIEKIFSIMPKLYQIYSPNTFYSQVIVRLKEYVSIFQNKRLTKDKIMKNDGIRTLERICQSIQEPLSILNIGNYDLRQEQELLAQEFVKDMVVNKYLNTNQIVSDIAKSCFVSGKNNDVYNLIRETETTNRTRIKRRSENHLQYSDLREINTLHNKGSTKQDLSLKYNKSISTIDKALTFNKKRDNIREQLSSYVKDSKKLDSTLNKAKYFAIDYNISEKRAKNIIQEFIEDNTPRGKVIQFDEHKIKKQNNLLEEKFVV